MLISLTVGKVDAGVAVLLTEDKRLIEFPSILLPPSITSGSIVDITVARNPTLEAQNQHSFTQLQSSIHETYGLQSPTPPVIRCRNATQTSIVLEWDPLDLATASLRSLSLFRNGAKAGVIPRLGRDGEEVLATKVSGLAVDTEYNFHLRLLTSAGAFSSQRLVCRTQKMTDLTGITVTPGPLPPPLRASLAGAVERIGAKLVEGVRIDTTHFVCTEGRGREWEKASEMNIPIVRPEWLEGCEREGRIVGVRGYYLGADPKLRQVGPGAGMRGATQNQEQPQSLSRPDTQRVESNAKTLPIRAANQGNSQGNLNSSSNARPSAEHPPGSVSPSSSDPPQPPAKDTPRPDTIMTQPDTASQSVSPLGTSHDDQATEHDEIAQEDDKGTKQATVASDEEDDDGEDEVDDKDTQEPATPAMSEHFSEVQL